VPINPAVIKNFHRRTFIDNGDGVDNKFSIVEDAVKDKSIALVDDSIVRGKTLKALVKLVADEAKPKEIHIISASPQIKFPNLYGVNISNKDKLIANEHKNLQEMAKELTANTVTFLSNEGFKKVLGDKRLVDQSIYNRDYSAINDYELVA